MNFHMDTNKMPSVNHRLYTENGNIISYSAGSKPVRGKLRGVGSDGSVINAQNCTAYNGRRFILESLLRQTPISTQKLTLNNVLNINSDTDSRTSAAEYAARKICLVGIGIGGAGETFGQVYDASVNDNNLFSVIPMRVVPISADLSASEQKQYAMKRQETINGSQYYCYYLKVVNPDAISVTLNSTNYSPTTEDNTYNHDASDPLSSENISVYATIPISIEATDAKEYFTYKYGSLKQARFNEMALFEAYYDPELQNYIHCECFSHITMNNRPMDTDGSKYAFNYYLIT